MIDKIKRMAGGVGGMALVLMMVLSVMAVPVSAGTADSVTVTVTGADGEVVEGEEVSIGYENQNYVWVEADSAETDADGTVTFDGLDSSQNYEVETTERAVNGTIVQGSGASLTYDSTAGEFVDANINLTEEEIPTVDATVEVLDSETFEPVENATVTMEWEGGDYSENVTTDADGMATVELHDSNDYRFSQTVEADGFETARTLVHMDDTDGGGEVLTVYLDSAGFVIGGGSGSGAGSSLVLIGGGLVVLVGLLGVTFVSMRD